MQEIISISVILASNFASVLLLSTGVLFTMKVTSNKTAVGISQVELDCVEKDRTKLFLILLASLPLTFREGIAYVNTCVWRKCHTNITSLSILIIISRKDREIERGREDDNLFIESDRLVY